MAVTVKNSKKEGLKKSLAKGSVEVEKSNEVPKEPEEDHFPVLTSENPVNLNFGAGYTKNLGNYESARINVSITMPCDANLEAIENTYEFMEDWVNKKMEAAISGLDE